MPGNPVRPKPERDLSAIPGTLSPEENRQRIKSEDEAMRAFIASMPEGDVLDYLRAPINLFSNAMAGLGAEMIGKGKRFEEKYGWKPKTQAEMNAVNSLLEVMDPAIAAMDYLKIPPVVGPNVPTIAAAMRGVDRAAVNLSGQQAAAAARKGATAAKNAVRDVATSDAAYDIMNRLAEATGAAPKQIMMGPMSKTWDHGNAALAKHMELQGKNPREIWQATGTFRGADGLWRQEIPDVDMRYTGNAVERKQYESAKKRHEQATARATTPEEVNDANNYWNKTRTDAIFNLTGKAPDFVNHPELFAAYPELSNYVFRQLEPTNSQFYASENVNGYFSPGGQRITINSNAPNKRSTALHELQHAIQEIEGWQDGASPEEVAARMAERDIAKTREADLLQSIQDMQKILPSSANNLILTEGQKLKNIQDFLNKTKQLEGETNPYDAYRKVSGEEEARMVQQRRNYPEEKLAKRPPFEDYESDPSLHITEFADGGAVMMGSNKKMPNDEAAFQNWVRGTDWFKEFKAEYNEEPDLDTKDYDYRAAWKAGVQPERDPYDNNRFHWPSSLPTGEMLKSADHPTAWKEYFMRETGVNPDALGLKTPEDANIFIENISKGQEKAAGGEVNKGRAASIGGEKFYNAALAAGLPLDNDTLNKIVDLVNAGHSVSKAAQLVKGGSEVHAAKGGILGALARTAERGVERAAKAAKPIESVVQVSTIKMPKAAQEVVSDAERAANLAKFLEQSKRKKRLYHGTNSDFSVFDASRAGENTDSNASSEAYAQTARLGHWLNTNPMAGPKAGYDVDMPVYVSIKNPKREISLDFLAQGLEGTTGKKYRDQLIKEGYDGIVLPDEEFGGESWVAFSPEQIKSALGNRGTYDINEKDITKAKGGEVHAAKGGFLGALARTAEKGVERAAKAAKVDIPPMGINVRTDSKLNIPFADLIVDGQKVYESRKSDSLRPYVNKSMSIVRTGNGPAKAIGSVEIGEPMIVDAKTFREMQDKHLVPEGSMFDIEAEGQKYLYPLSNSRRFDQELDVGHGIKARKVIFPDDLDKKKGGEVTIDEFLNRMKAR